MIIKLVTIICGIEYDNCFYNWYIFLVDKTSKDQEPCSNHTPIIISVVLSIVIVLSGSIINFIFWRKKAGKRIVYVCIKWSMYSITHYYCVDLFVKLH